MSPRPSHLLYLVLALAAACDCSGTPGGQTRPGDGGSGGTIGGGGSGGTGGIDPSCDVDNDRHLAIRCGGDDCDDLKENVQPGAAEVCDDALADEDCDGERNEGCPCTPGAERACYPPGDEDPTRGVGTCADGVVTCREDGTWTDCEGAVVPQEELDVCDDLDQDCDGTADEDLQNACGVCGETPVEICQNGFDDDCNGTIDDPTYCYVSCAGVDPSAPPSGLECCVVDSDGDEGSAAPMPEPYAYACTEYEGMPACSERACVDLDGDPGSACTSLCTESGCVCGADPGDGGAPVASAGCGYETPCNRLDCDLRENQPCYSGPPQTLGKGICRGGSHSCVLEDDGTRRWTECTGETTPALEVCDNGSDEDCDGLLDEEDGATGEPCEFTRGCDDDETCGNGLDDDCNGLADEGCAATGDEQDCYLGPPATRGVGACKDGVQEADGEFWGACVGSVVPGVEICFDGVDTDCDGLGGEGTAEEAGCCTPGDEVCNGGDDDCDGLVDEGLTNACGKCGEACYTEKFPPDGNWDCGEPCNLDGTGPGDPDDPDSQCGAGELCLNKSRYDQPYIWIARTLENKVQKINTSTFEVVQMANGTNATDVFGWSPSRTAVAVDGSVWVGHRGCERNLNNCDGDDPAHGNAVHLASDGSLICRANTASPANGAEKIATRAVTLDQYENAWLGNWDEGVIYQFSGSEVDDTQDPPACKQLRKIDLVWNGKRVKAYGAAVDSRGDLWVATLGSGPTLRINTSSGEVVNAINLPWSSYGLAIDEDHNVWFGVWASRGGVMRLDGETSEVTQPRPPTEWNGEDLTCEQTSRTRGVAVDFEQHIWVANYDCDSTSKYDKAGNHLGTFPVGRQPLGMAVATDGRIWAVNLGAATATVLDPTTGEQVTTVTGLNYPYSYSDMTGLQLRLVTRQNGSWITTYDSGYAGARWYRVDMEGRTPAGTSICLRVRAAGTRAALATARWTGRVCVPSEAHPESKFALDVWHPAAPGQAPGAGTLFLGDAENPEELPDMRFLQLEVDLNGDNGVSPVVTGLEAYWDRP